MFIPTIREKSQVIFFLDDDKNVKVFRKFVVLGSWRMERLEG